MRDPSGLNAAGHDRALVPAGRDPLPLAASHTRAVLSSDAVTMRVPSGLNAARRPEPSCPRSTTICLPVAASHTRAVLSDDAVTMRVRRG